MSEAVRNALAGAATSVSGVKCEPYYRQSTRVGNASVRLDRIDYPNRLGGIAHWQVVVALPQDQKAAEKWIDDHAGALRAALAQEMAVRSVAPFQMQLDTASFPALVVSGDREMEN